MEDSGVKRLKFQIGGSSWIYVSIYDKLEKAITFAKAPIPQLTINSISELKLKLIVKK